MGNRLELLSALGLILWGTWVASPFWDSFGTVDAYSILVQIAPGRAFGMGAILLGFLQVIGAHYLLMSLRKVAAMITLFFWILLSLAIFAGNFHSTGAVGYLIFAVMNIAIFYELSLRRSML